MKAPVKTSRARLTTAVVLVTAVASTTLVPGAASASHPASTEDRLTLRQLQRETARVLAEGRFVGITVRVRDGARTVRARAGEAELHTGRPVPRGVAFRIGSVTKTFVATVVLQLVAEGRLSLDDTVERRLPGVVSGNGNDGSRITVRNLLQHTSGLHNYGPEEDTGNTAADFERTRFDHWDPEQLVAGAVRHRPDFPPAPADDPEPDWNYSNPGYLLAGMIIERVTGRPWAVEVRDRIILPLGLTGTYAPGDDPYLKPPHAHTYHRFPGSVTWTDTTARNVSSAGAGAALVSTERDVDRFFTALLGGRLLPTAQLAEMRRTVSVGEDFEVGFPGLRYGLGLMQQPLTCGGDTWGHGGDLEGFTVRTGFTADRRRSVVVVANGTGGDEQRLAAERAVRGLVDRALCGGVG
ncbi:serine hydrolase domain-containing protein [Streptomyces sp. AM8-1-1]|uniref:serine hydrolase domain-containing protein n=1 Tax=Streptomyces sp. AM8-1-1 TaxID=3075825 RepID=UPI0028C44EC6|nr:serine hydrolase domain-containing protein [Streptomyces sp. AM8-1-1]WNO76629.1 serine hydrolase domain-containing protein [Streptomyces sp. AM8-1-1]